MTENTAGSGAADPFAARAAGRVGAGTGARAGALAALAMLAIQLLWRLAFSPAGVQALPEYVVAAVARLTPLGLFGFATETFGSLAQNALFVATLVATVVIGYEGGGFAARLANRFGSGLPARLGAGLALAAALLLFTLLVVLPIARLGAFAADSRQTGTILVQLGTTFAFFGVAWALLARPAGGARGTAAAGASVLDRRSLLGRVAANGGVVALLTAVGGLGWRLMRPPSKVDRAVSEQSARNIVATAEARSRGPVVPAAPTSAPPPPPNLAAQPAVVQPQAPAPTEATDPLDGPPAAAATDAAAEFARLEAEAGLSPRLTTVADFYHVSKNISDPVVDGEGWSLKFSGLVERPFELSYEDLFARATTRKITTLCCISNELNGDLVGTAEWTGVPLGELLAEAGVRPEAIDLKFSCADDYEDSIPVAQGLDPDTLVVVGMNGEPLPPDHGYPARLIVPGIYGMKNVKWVREIEAVGEDFKGYWQTRGWSDPAPYQIWGRIDTPASGDELAPGLAVAAGLASAGDRGISRVEVSLDDGETWAEAELEPALNPPLTWVRWRFPFEAVPGKHKLKMRATDGADTVAPEEREPPLPAGATGWPDRTVRVEDE